MSFVVGEAGTAEHDKTILGDPQLCTHGGLAPVPRPGLRIHGVEYHLNVVPIPAVGNELFLAPVAHSDHLILPLVQHPI